MNSVSVPTYTLPSVAVVGRNANVPDWIWIDVSASCALNAAPAMLSLVRTVLASTVPIPLRTGEENVLMP